MPTTLLSLRENIASRLGDSDYRVWSEDQIESFINDVQEQFCQDTGLLREAWPMDELPRVSNYNYPFEKQFMTATRTWALFAAAPTVKPAITYDRANYNYPWERDFSDDGVGPASCNQAWERDQYFGDDTLGLIPAGTDPLVRAYVAPVRFLGNDFIPATVILPERAVEALRVVWDGRRVWPQNSNMIGDRDRLFEEIPGQFDQYTIMHDGMRYLRKYRIPAGRGVHDVVAPNPSYAGMMRGFLNYDALVFTAFDLFNKDFWNYCGLPTPGTVWTTVTSHNLKQGWSGGYWDGATIMGTFGAVRRLPGMRISGGPYGIIRRLSYDNQNTVFEARRRCRRVVADNDTFDVPEPLLRFIRDKVTSMLLMLPGPGFDDKLAKFYDGRYMVGVGLARSWMDRVHKMKRRAYGKNPKRPYPPARVQWPYHYSGPQGWKV